MTDLETTADKLRALAGVQHVRAIEPGTLQIDAVLPIDFAELQAIVGDTMAVSVYPMTIVADDDVDLWRGGTDFMEVLDRTGHAVTSGEADKLAKALGITTPPTLNALFAGMLGYLFASAADAQIFDEIK